MSLPIGKGKYPVNAGGEKWPKPTVQHTEMAEGIPLPSAESPTWRYVFAFACAMEYKLSQNRRKGVQWRRDNVADLQDHLDEEVEELDSALADIYQSSEGSDRKECKKEVLLECADVANYAMMIADNVNANS